MNTTVGMICFCIFLVFLIGVSIWSAQQNKKGKTGADREYFLGGNTTPLIVLAVSYCASAVSAGSFMGDPGMMSVVGWPYYWIAIFAVPGLVIPGIYVIRKMRLQSDRYGSMTINEYAGHRFNSPGLKLYLSFIIVLCYLFMMVSQFKAAAILLEMFTGLDFTVGLIVMCVVCLVYVNIGGLRSVAWTDFVQGLIMCLMCIVVVATALSAIGGFSGLNDAIEATNPDMNLIVQPVEEGADVPGLYGVIGAFVFGFCVYFAQPHIAARFMALPDVNRKSIGRFLIVSLVCGWLFNLMFIVGPIGRMLYPDADGDYMTVTFVTEQFPSVIASILMLGFFSAVISTATSILLVAGQSVGRDIYGQICHKTATPEKQVRVTQIGTTVIIALVLVFNLIDPPEFLQLFIYMGMSGIGSACFCPLVIGTMWKKSSKEGAWASAIAGPVGYLVHSQIHGPGWLWCMGVCCIWSIVAFFVVTFIRNAVKGTDPVLEELWNPLGGKVDFEALNRELKAKKQKAS